MGLTQIELQEVRHQVGKHDLIAKKLRFYASQVQDMQVQQLFEKAANDADTTKQELMGYLN